LKQLVQILRGNFEKVFIGVSIIAAALITYFIPNNISFLNFFFLPVILAGYYVGIRLSVPGAVFCVCLVVFYAVVSPVSLQQPHDTVQVVLFVLTWGCFLILAGALVGNQQEKIRRESAKLVDLNAEITAAYEKLKKARVETVIGMATLSECRDFRTGLHLQRVSRLCKVLAEELRREPEFSGYITDEYVNDLVLSSILHDIGKVGTPDSVLLKPSPLTEDEFELAKAHTLIGGNALDEVEKRMGGRSFFTLGKQIAYCHHERWDGTGYPRGLSGDDIPLSARIVSVADTYDAITMDRVYRKGMPHEEAMRRICEASGTQFDPRVVEALVACQERVKLSLNAVPANGTYSIPS
jgi:HD-GYP domain-containing protein (c-di-GMP phosphodiesterase class II)